jgi:ribokinase
MTAFSAIGFGALNVDKLFRVDSIAAAEEESFIIDRTEACGGSAANTMVGLARLGSKVGFIGKVSDDSEGRKLLEDFKREGVDTTGIAIAESGRSGTVMAFVDKEGQRALYADPGVNNTLRFNEISQRYFSKAEFLHLTSFVGETSFQTQKRLCRALPERIKLSVDPGAFYAKRGSVELAPIIERTFAFMPNNRELQLLTGKSNYRDGAKILLEMGVQVVAVKLGSRGCYVTDGKESHLVRAFKVKVVDTTGAGDAFSAGFLFGLTSRRSFDICGRIGNFLASRCITKVGARAGLPTVEELEENDWYKS